MSQVACVLWFSFILGVTCIFLACKILILQSYIHVHLIRWFNIIIICMDILRVVKCPHRLNVKPSNIIQPLFNLVKGWVA